MITTATDATAARSGEASDPTVIQAELDRLDRAFQARRQDDRPMPACIAMAYRTLIARRRKQLLALQR